MFKCKGCKRSTRKGETQFKIVGRRPYTYMDGFKGEQIFREYLVCFGCFRRGNDG